MRVPDIDFQDIKPVLAVAALIAWCYLPSILRRTWVALGHLIGVATATELGGFLVMIFGYHNLWIYNTFLLVQLPLILRLIHSMTWSKGLRTWGKWLLALRIIVTLGEIGTKSFTEELYNSTALLDGTIVTGLFVVLLFTLSNEDLEPIYHSPKFWVALAFVLFYGPTIPLYGLITYLTERNVRLASQLYVINDILFILFYSILIMVLSRMIPAGMKVIKHVG